MTISNVITLLGGLGMFIYGMNKMSESLERAAGDRLQKIIEMLAGNVFKGILMGAVVTALVQSSSATTVMVVGFVNAGIMSLAQAVGVIMGANIGTTITSWIISLGDIEGFMSFLKPKSFAPILLVIGVIAIMSCGKKKRLSDVGGILIGFGLLFIGMYTMEESVKALRSLPQFTAAFATFSNPIIGVLVGAGVTALLQSSSASVGILQAAGAAGLVTFSSAVPVVMGQNIGTCVTALISSAGASKNARRAAMIHLYFNLIGTVIIMTIFYTFKHYVGIPFWEQNVTRFDIAIFHTIFNISNTILLLPFSKFLVMLANKTVKGMDDDTKTKYIDDRFLSTPSLALSQTMKEIVHMGELAKENIELTSKLVLDRDTSVIDIINEKEDIIDSLEIELTDYLTKVAERPVTAEDNRIIAGLFHTINDIERIGDHAMNIMELTDQAYRKKIEFSKTAISELRNVYECISKIMSLSIKAYQTDNMEIAHKIEPLEEVIDELIEKLKERHLARLCTQDCKIHSGFLFSELLTNFERIGDHCSNIGIATIQRNDKTVIANTHLYLQDIHKNMNEDYKANYEKYLKRYDV